MIIVIPLIIYCLQLVTILMIIIVDSIEEEDDKLIRTKKQAYMFLIPFGFIISFYYWFKKLN